MHWVRAIVAAAVGLVATLVVVAGCLYLGLGAFMVWLVTCTGPFYESGCDRSDNGLLWIGFLATAFVVVAGAGTTLALLFRWLGRWIEPDREPKPMMPLVKVTAVFGGAAFVLFVTGTTIVEANREPSAWEEQNRQTSEQALQDREEVCALVAAGDFTSAHEAALTSESLMDLVRPLADLSVFRPGDDMRLLMNASEHVDQRCQTGSWEEIAALVNPPIPQADIVEAAGQVDAVLADVCGAAANARFGVAQRTLDDAVVLRRLEDVLGALHDRIARAGEPQIIEGWIDEIRAEWCPNLPATDDLLAMWASSHRTVQVRFVVSSDHEPNPCDGAERVGISAGVLVIDGPAGVVGSGHLDRGDGIGPVDDVKCYMRTYDPIPVEIVDTYRLTVGDIEAATFTDAEVVASGGEFEIALTLGAPATTGEVKLRPRAIGTVHGQMLGSEPLAGLEAVLGSDHLPLRVDEIGPSEVVEWPEHRLSVAVSVGEGNVFRSLASWEYRGDSTVEFVTDEGITVGSSVADLEAAYGNRLLWSQPRQACGEGWIFVVGDDRFGRIEGLLDGPPDQASTVVLLWSGEELRCRQAAPRAVAVSTTTTLEPTTTTIATTTTTTTTVTPDTAPQPLVLPDGVELLTAHSDGIDLLSGSSSVPVLTGVDVALAWPDYLGGVVFQRVADRPEWELDHDLDRWRPIWTDSAEVSGIEWIREIGGPAEMLVSGDELSTVSPYRADTTLIEGAATLVYHRVSGVEHPCDDVMSEDECMWRTAHGFAEHVIALDLETGQERPLGIRDVYETYSDVSIGGSVAAVTGAEPTEVAMVDVADLAVLGTTGHVLETVPSAWMVYTPEHHCEHQPPESYGKPGLEGHVSPDGTTLALVESHPPCSDGEDPSTYVVVIDVGGRTDDPVYELNTRLPGPYAWILDYDGEHVLIEAGSQSIVVDRHGTITTLPDCECTYRFWNEPS